MAIQPYDIEMTGVRPNGEIALLSYSRFPSDENWQDRAPGWIAADITERNESRPRVDLASRPAFDELTQLPNRRMLHDRFAAGYS